MRWLFLLLLVLNLGVFLWSYQYEMNTAGKLPVPKPGVGNLRLWSEVQPPVIAEAEPETEPEVEPVVEVESELEIAEPVAALPVVPVSVVELSQPEPQDAPEPELQPEPAVESEQVLVAEGPEVDEAKPEPVMVEIAMLKPEEEPDPEAEPACFKLGYLELRDAADGIAGQLTDAGIAAAVQDELVQIEAGYWVVIPPLPTDNEARQMVRDLKKAGIKDVWRFAGGAKKNTISLGLFSMRLNAERAKRRAVGKGFQPEVQPRYSDKQRYWLELSSTKQPPLPDDLLQQWEDDYPGLELTPRDCP